MNDTDQTVVMVRPKYYIGSSGSVWASDYMFLTKGNHVEPVFSFFVII